METSPQERVRWLQAKTLFSDLPENLVGAIADWTRHFLSLGSYSLFNNMESAVDIRKTTDEKQYYADRRRDALKYGSGGDYEH